MADTKAEVLLRAEALGMSFLGPEGEIHLFDDLDLTIGPGQSVAVLGASGSGKSTLLGLLAGLDLPTRGRVVLAGEDLTALNEDGRAGVRSRVLGFVFQAFHLLTGLTALENVMLPLELRGDDRVAERARRALNQVGLGRRMGHYPRQLSGGEQQRVAIARAFVTGPRLLMADEPTGNLDQETGHRISDLLFQLNAETGTTLLLVTHDPELAKRCGRVLRLDQGSLVEA